jgi:hypothetical protein
VELMPLKSAPYYWVECDKCGGRADYGDYAAWMDASSAVEQLDDSGWLTINSEKGELYYCTDCTVWSDEDCLVVRGDES